MHEMIIFINGICVDTVTTTQPHKRAVSHPQRLPNTLARRGIHPPIQSPAPSPSLYFFLDWWTMSMIFSTTDGSESCAESR